MKQKLDITDISITKLLQQNCALTNKQIADLIHKSEATVSARIKRLKNDGYIIKMVAVLEPKLLGNNVVGFLNFNLADVSEISISNFKEELSSIDGVCECYKTVGQYDILIKIITKNLQSFAAIESRISSMKYVTNRSSHCVTSTIVPDNGFDF